MARNPVTRVLPVRPVGAVRKVERGSIYFRHLEQWRIYSEVQGAERRRQLAQAVSAPSLSSAGPLPHSDSTEHNFREIYNRQLTENRLKQQDDYCCYCQD